jgi:NAD(P)-dependent dehydrogenase (short-subunit alcohol dehydrogenase family)
VKHLGGEALAITTDITREDQVDRMVAKTMSAFGRSKDFVGYCTSKGGIDSMTLVLACEWGKHNIQVNAIAPSLFETSAKAKMGNPNADPDYTRRLLERIPLN